MNRYCCVLLIAVALLFAARAARAEPYLAVAQGYKCSACHVNPTGGGLRNAFGVIYSETVLPARGLPAGAPTWTGSIADVVRVGGDLRAGWSRSEVPGSRAQQDWALEQLRLYGHVGILAERLALYVDEALAPGTARNLEAYVRYSDPARGWYVKAGQFYLPFGWRLQDNTALVRAVTGISMTTPDNGIELGLERGDFSFALDVSNGAANTGTGSGYQLVGQTVWIRPRGRVGLSGAFTHSDAGDRSMLGVHGGLRTGPLVWLGEADLVRDEGFPGGARQLLTGLGEVNWSWRRGHNLKLTAEYFDPDRDVAEDHKARYSLLYEYTPMPFLQVRAGARRYRGIPQNVLDNRRALFLEFHGFF